MPRIEGEPKGGLITVAGVGIGVLWVAVAAVLLWSAAVGFANDRNDWGVGWGLVGMLLLGAGSSAIVGTLWHLKHRDEDW